jgi:TolB-like protein
VPPLAVLSPAQNEALAQALAFDRASRTASVERLLAGLAPDKVSRGRQNLVLGVAIATAAAVSLTYLAANKLWNSGRSVVVQPVAAQVQPAASRATAVAAFNPPPHSIAVLPFVNMTGDTEQEYFSDGLTEEVLSSLAAIEGLQVAAGTSSFSFKENPDIVAVAHKLNVASVLEGSVRRSEHTVRVSVLLVNAVTGFQLWSKTYDRDLGDALKLQSDIAAAVAQALKVTLLGNVAAKAERGGTPNPAAFAAYPGGRKAHVRGDAHQALAIVPERAEGYLAPAPSVDGSLDFAQASEAHEQARALAPGNAEALRVNAGVIPGLPVEIKVDHLSGNAGFFSPADADSGAGSGDTSGEASGEGDSDDRSGAGAAAGNRAAVFARPESQALRAARAAADESGSLHLIRALAGRSGTAEVDSGNGVAAGNPRTGLSRRHQPAEGVPGATEAPRA